MTHLDRIGKRILPVVPVIVSVIILYGRLLVEGKVVFWGTPILQFIPWWNMTWESLHNGVLPFWNPLNGMGSPLLANYQLGFFYIPNWLLLIFAEMFGTPGIAIGFTLLEIFHLIASGFGMVLFLRSLRLYPLSQVVGSLAFVLSGYITARSGFFSMVWAASWLPWLFYAVERELPLIVNGANGIKKRVVVPLLFVFCFSMQLLSGHAQLTWYSLQIVFLWVVFRLVSLKDKNILLWGILSFGSAVLTSFLIAGLQLLPTFEYLSQSYRSSSLPPAEALVYSFWPWRLLTFFFPGLFGSPASGDYWGYGAYWEDAIYIGIIPLLAAITTLRIFFRPQGDANFSNQYLRACWFFWGMSVFSMALALGSNSPVFLFLFQNIPTFNMFQAPTRYLLWLVFGFSVLAGIGIHHLKPPSGRVLYWTRLGTMGGVAVTLGAFLAQFVLGDIKGTFIQSVSTSGIWLVAFGILALALPRNRFSRRFLAWEIIVVVILAADLIVTNWGLIPGLSTSYFMSSPNIPIKSFQLRSYFPREDENAVKFKRYFRFDRYISDDEWIGIRSSHLPNLNLLENTASANNFDPLVPVRYWEWITKLEETEAPVRQKMLELMNVSELIEQDPDTFGQVNIRQIGNPELFRWYTCTAAVKNGEDAWNKVFELMNQENYANILVIETNTVDDDQKCHENQISQIQIIKDTSTEAVFYVESDNDGWVFLSNVWYPGWQAEVDGKETKIYRANYLFQAIPVVAGRHEVRIQYIPILFYWGLASSITGIGLVIISIYINWRLENNTRRMG